MPKTLRNTVLTFSRTGSDPLGVGHRKGIPYDLTLPGDDEIRNGLIDFLYLELGKPLFGGSDGPFPADDFEERGLRLAGIEVELPKEPHMREGFADFFQQLATTLRTYSV